MAAAQRSLSVRRDIDYVLANRGELMLVDNLSGEGRPTHQLNEGLDEALHARNGLPIRTSDDVIAQATVAELYGKAEHLAGMTATPDMPIDLFRELHGLRTAEMPSEKAVRLAERPMSCTCPRTCGWALRRNVTPARDTGDPGPQYLVVSTVRMSKKVARALRPRASSRRYSTPRPRRCSRRSSVRRVGRARSLS